MVHSSCARCTGPASFAAPAAARAPSSFYGGPTTISNGSTLVFASPTTAAQIAPLQLHRGLDRLDALASRSNGLTERRMEALIGFDRLRVHNRRGNRRL